jgi:ABC-type taurine transport system ATPase subunit
MSELRLNAVTFAYDRSAQPVLDRLTLGVARGEFVVVLGQSGSGKTSLLNIAAGFLEPTEGRVSVDGKDIAGPGADRAVVFQDDALYAWLNARDNVALGALDAMTREHMQELLLTIWRQSNTGALLITHSVEEALFLATRVVVLAAHPGRIAKVSEYDFGRRFLAGEAARKIKSDPDFVRAREELIEAIEDHSQAVAA